MQHIKIKQSATSLTSLLISILLNSIIILTLFQTYIITKKYLIIIEQQIILLYNQIIADYFLRSNLINAGYKGYMTTLTLPEYSSVNTEYNTQIIPKAPLATCKAIIDNCTGFVPASILNKITESKIKPNSTILLAYDIPEQSMVLQNNMDNYDSPIPIVTNKISWKNGDQLIIADHQVIQRFVLSKLEPNKLMHNQPYNNSPNFIKKFQQGAQIFRAKHIAFYIAQNKLYVEDFIYRAEAILDHVEDFNIKLLNDYTPNTGWISNKYILINILFKIANKTQNFSTGIEIFNSN